MASDGLARLSPFAARVLAVLLPACRNAAAKVLVTSTAAFELPAQLQGLLPELELGSLEPSDVAKLWTRGRERELREVSPGQWAALSERLGRNTRVLDWARTLLDGRSVHEIDQLVAKARLEVPDWSQGVADPTAQARLAALSLFHAAIDRAQAEAQPELRRFLARARVYDLAVPLEAFLPLGDGLALDLPRAIPALANLGLLEFGSFAGRRAYRVSPLVIPELKPTDAERSHRVAAAYFEGVAQMPEGWRTDLVLLAWEHSLAARAENLAARLGSLLRPHLHRQGLYLLADRLAQRQLAAFPLSFFATLWAGNAAAYAGRVLEARALFERAEAVAQSRTVGEADLSLLHHEFAGVLRAQGDLLGARRQLERSLEITRKVLGTDEHPSVAASLHALAGVLSAQGESAAAIALLRRVLAIEAKVYGTREHYSTAETEFALGMQLLELGEREEGTVLVVHALEVLRAQAPAHPILQQLERASGAGDPGAVARAALEIRAGSARTERFEQELAGLRGAGEPLATIAGYLDAIAQRGDPQRVSLPPGSCPLDQAIAELPAEVAAFLQQVRDAALALDTAGKLAP